MKLIDPKYDFMFIENGVTSLKRIETIARTCYKSEGTESDDERTKRFVKGLITRGHDAMLEHSMLSVRFTAARGIANEIVRHRHFSFAQESTRYCKYSGEVEFIKPFWYDKATFNDKMIFEESLVNAEATYQALLDNGHTAQEAREILPHALKTEIVVTGNYREWRHFMNLRAANSTGPAHPDMNRIMCPLLIELHERIPVIFDDIYEEMLNDPHATKYIESYKYLKEDHLMKVYVADTDAGFYSHWTPKYMLFPNDVSFNDLYDSILDAYIKEYNKNNPSDNGDPLEDLFFQGIAFKRHEGDCDIKATICNDYLE